MMKKYTVITMIALLVSAGIAQAVSMSYTASIEGTDKHKDTSPPSKLLDGRYNSAVTRSVEYRGDPELVFTLDEVTEVKKIEVAYYQLSSALIARIDLEISKDGITWEPAGTVDEFKLAQGVSSPANMAEFRVREEIKAFKLFVTRNGKSKRVFLGEVIVK